MSDTSLDFAGLDTQLDATLDTPIETSQSDVSADTDSQRDQQGNQQQLTEKVDGRRGPASIRNSIKAAAEWAVNNAADALPEHAQAMKELGNAYYREQAYRQVWPTVEEAQSAKQLIEGIGGIEGIGQLQQATQQYEQQDFFLRDGDPQALDPIFSNFAEGVAALTPHFLDRLAKENPEAYATAITPRIISMLDGANIGGFLQELSSETDLGKLTAGIKQLTEWYERQRGSVSQLKPTQNQAKNPSQDRISQREQEVNDKERKMFNGEISTEINSLVGPEMSKYVDKYARDYGLGEAQKIRFHNLLLEEVKNQMLADKVYKQQDEINWNSKNRTAKSVASYRASEFNRRLRETSSTLAKELYGAPKPGRQVNPQDGVQKPGAPKTGPTGGPLKVSTRPDNSQIDTRPGKTTDLHIIKGQAWLKDGRFVTWR